MIQEPDALPDDTFSLMLSAEGVEAILATNVRVDDIPTGPYVVESTEEGTIKVGPVPEANGPYSGTEGSEVAFTAAGSNDSDGTIVLYEWDFDADGVYDASSSEATVSCTWGDDYSSDVILRVTDSDGLTTVDAAEVTVSNVAPIVGDVAAPVNPVQVNTVIYASASFTDPGPLDIHTAVWDWGDGRTSPGTVNETNGSGSVADSHTYTAPRVYTITLTVTDDDGGSSQSVYQYVVVYDPAGGFVTGGGWINSPAGAYQPNTEFIGKANFGFISSYQKGASVPTGNTEFQFHVANLNFQSTSYQWLVISRARAQYKGSGTINGAGDYGFILTSIDGQITGGGGTDKFRIKIWDKLEGAVIYDNQLGASDDGNPTMSIAGGSIVIHK